MINLQTLYLRAFGARGNFLIPTRNFQEGTRMFLVITRKFLKVMRKHFFRSLSVLDQKVPVFNKGSDLLTKLNENTWASLKIRQ